jgi:hypothetical protein
VVARTSEVELPGLVPAGLEVLGWWHWNHQRHRADSWTMIRRSARAIGAMMTHRKGLEEVSSVRDLQDQGSCGEISRYLFGRPG